MTQPIVTINPAVFEESPLYSFSSRSNSPLAQHKLSTIPFEFTDNTRPGSFFSYQTPTTRKSSLSNTQDLLPKLSDDSIVRLHDKIKNIKLEIESPKHKLHLDIPVAEFSDDLESGLPSLRWCPYCKAETATEVFFKNSSKTF